MGREIFSLIHVDSNTEFRILASFSPCSADCALGLRLADWPGRTQLIEHGRVLYLLDGAHTEESIQVQSISENLAKIQGRFKLSEVYNDSGEKSETGKNERHKGSKTERHYWRQKNSYFVII